MSVPSVQFPTSISQHLSPHATDATTTNAAQAPAAAVNHLHPHDDARSIVRFVQCSQCSYPFRTPVTLPCGNSLCRQCLPPAHIREHVSYPATPSRESGITCPFPECGREHTLDDCSVDVILLDMMDTVAQEMRRARTEASEEQRTSVEEIPHVPECIPTHGEDLSLPDTSILEKAHARTLHGGRLVATYTFAEMGELHYLSDARYEESGEGADEAARDCAIYSRLQEVCRDNAECQVCYGMLLEPITTPCGHSFCKKCLTRSLDHSALCPHCRRDLHLSPTLTNQKCNLTLLGLLHLFWTEELQSRKEAFEEDEQIAARGLNTALFVCTVSYPHMPMILHVFEPRYRLMIRRALEGNRQFGMVPYNTYGQSQGDLGRTQFLRIGTMLHIEQCQIQPDGRSWLLCRGVYRFKVLQHGALDGYVVGRVQRHDDIALSEEERIEAEETNRECADSSDVLGQIDRMSTSELFLQGQQFMERARAQSVRWLSNSVQEVYGGPPDDPAIFPYWFASIVPFPDEEKYKLLPTTSVRERLKIMVKWIKKIESARWSPNDLDLDEDSAWESD